MSEGKKDKVLRPSATAIKEEIVELTGHSGPWVEGANAALFWALGKPVQPPSERVPDSLPVEDRIQDPRKTDGWGHGPTSAE